MDSCTRWKLFVVDFCVKGKLSGRENFVAKIFTRNEKSCWQFTFIFFIANNLISKNPRRNRQWNNVTIVILFTKIAHLFFNINFLLLIFNYYYYYLKQILLFSIFIPPRIHDPIVTKQCTISQQIFLHPSSSNSLIASLRRGGEKKHEEADFEKGMEISRKTTCKYFVSRGEKGSIYRPFLPTAGLWIKSRRCRVHSRSEAESLGEKTHEIGRLLAINRHPPTFPLNKSARHILDTRIPSWRSCFRPIPSPLANFECVIRGKWDEVVEMKSRFFYAQVVYANLKYY